LRVYVREPNGILFELATDGPGFNVDEDSDALAGSLALPPFLGPQREQDRIAAAPVGTR